MEIKASLRGIAPQTLYLLLFLVVLGSGYAFSEFISTPVVDIPFVITETGQAVTFSMSLGKILEIIAWSFGLILAGYLLIERNLAIWEGQGMVSVRKKDLIFHLFIIAGIMIATGNILHVYFNTLNGMVEDFAETSFEGWTIFVLVYDIDEQVSHGLIHVGILLLIAMLLAAEPVNIQGDLTSKIAKNTMFTMLLGFVMGAVQAFAALEGQAGILVLLGSWTIMLMVLVVHFRAGQRGFDTLRLFERPNLGFFACFIIAATITIIVWGLIFGFVPAYPFFKQPGDVF
nr:hypothetical protein [Candidatus Sigynarchaeota archaeon]